MNMRSDKAIIYLTQGDTEMHHIDMENMSEKSPLPDVLLLSESSNESFPYFLGKKQI